MCGQRAEIRRWSKAWVALVAGLSSLGIYMLACVLSPVSWSPDGSRMAILVTPPGEDFETSAIFAYAPATDERVRLDEVEGGGFLSPPAWSPDGQWIAYYRIDPNRPKAAGAAVPDPLDVEPMFSEDNRVLPPGLFEMAEELVDEEQDSDKFVDIKLMLVKPDGTERKVLRVMRSEFDKDDRNMLVLMRPAWSPDSKRLYYARLVESAESFYVGSVDIATGDLRAHLLGGLGSPAVSPDGRWVASLLEGPDDGTVVTVARTDGTAHHYIKVDADLPDGPLVYSAPAWTWDSKRLLVGTEEGIRIVEVGTGNVEVFRDPDAPEIAYLTPSPTGDKVYYLAGHSADGDEAAAQVELKCVALQSRRIETLFRLSDIPDFDGQEGGTFSVSPNGKRVVLRAVIEGQNGEGQSVLVIWDGTGRKVVNTDRWLLKPLYTDADLVYDKKLIGTWKGQDDTRLKIEAAGTEAYRLAHTDTDGQVQRFGGRLVKLKGATFLAVFFDAALAQKGRPDKSHLVPDILVPVRQIDTKLVVVEMDTEESRALLRMDAEALQREIAAAEVMEFERVEE